MITMYPEVETKKPYKNKNTAKYINTSFKIYNILLSSMP